jgi:hypothetical protein
MNEELFITIKLIIQYFIGYIIGLNIWNYLIIIIILFSSCKVSLILRKT